MGVCSALWQLMLWRSSTRPSVAYLPIEYSFYHTKNTERHTVHTIVSWPNPTQNFSKLHRPDWSGQQKCHGGNRIGNLRTYIICPWLCEWSGQLMFRGGQHVNMCLTLITGMQTWCNVHTFQPTIFIIYQKCSWLCWSGSAMYSTPPPPPPPPPPPTWYLSLATLNDVVCKNVFEIRNNKRNLSIFWLYSHHCAPIHLGPSTTCWLIQVPCMYKNSIWWVKILEEPSKMLTSRKAVRWDAKHQYL